MNFFYDEQESIRLDSFLSKTLKQSRNQVLNLIKANQVKVNDRFESKASYKLRKNDTISLIANEKKDLKADKEESLELDFDIEILYEDECILVLNKPPKLVVHAAQSVKEATLVDWLRAKKYMLSTLSGESRAGLVHRLDKGTSGAILIAKDNQTHQILSQQLATKTMGRYYLALIDKKLKDDKIITEKAIARSPFNRLKKIALAEGQNSSLARSAKTAFVNLIYTDESQNSKQKSLALIAAKLFTGRTHQIRAHLESLNRHILGDELYGYKGEKYERVMLHAYALYFQHPKTKQILHIKAPIYNDFDIILNKNFTKGELDEKLDLEYICQLFSTFV